MHEFLDFWGFFVWVFLSKKIGSGKNSSRSTVPLFHFQAFIIEWNFRFLSQGKGDLLKTKVGK